MAAVIFNGAFVKALKNQLKLGDDVYFLHGSDDPSSVAKDAPRGSIYIRDDGANGSIWVKQDNGSSTNWSPQLITDSAIRKTTAGITVNGFGVALTPGFKGYVYVPFAGTITAWSIVADQSGSCVFDVWKDTTIPTVADTITASAKPTLTAAQNVYSTTLTGWTTSVAAGDILGFNLDSSSSVTTATLQIWITR